MPRAFLLLLALSLLACEQRTPPSPAAPAPTAAPAAARSGPAGAKQPPGADPPPGLTANSYFELGEASAADRIYVWGMTMATKPFDPSGATLGLLSIRCPRPDEPLGPEALAFTREFLAARQAWLDTPWQSKTDPAHGYAYFYRFPDGGLLNAELVRRGYARVTDVGRPETVAMLRRLEEEARGARVGIWR
jgi:Staphylococcal nuclease homologue